MLNEPRLCVTGEELPGDMHANQRLQNVRSEQIIDNAWTNALESDS